MAPSKRGSWFLALSLCMLGMATAGCAEKQQARVLAMVPIGTTGDYGYSETMTGADLYTVRYSSPTLSATEAETHSHGLDGEKQRAYDLALWRAAQLAQAAGRPAFEVQHESRDVDVTVHRERIYPAYAPVPYFYGRHCRWPCYRPGYYPYYSDYDRVRTRVTGRVFVELKVKLLPQKAPGAFDAAATDQRLRQSYGGASYPLK